MIKVIVNGATGQMGSLACEHIERDPELQLVGRCTRKDDLAKMIQHTQTDVVVDLTTAASVFENAKIILDCATRPVIGTTGLLPQQIDELTAICHMQQIGGIIAPNFSIGALLMMRFAELAAVYLPHAEIIELHHPLKLDSPSGTSLKTAQMIAAHRKETPELLKGKEIVSGARGAEYENINIHSVRLPGLVAHQQVLFGGYHETLTIRHDSMHRESFMPGVLLAIKKSMALNEMVYGLEKLI